MKWIEGELFWSHQQTALITMIPKHMKRKSNLGYLGRRDIVGLTSTQLEAGQAAQCSTFLWTKCDNLSSPSRLPLHLYIIGPISALERDPLSFLQRNGNVVELVPGNPRAQKHVLLPGLPQHPVVSHASWLLRSLLESAPFSFHPTGILRIDSTRDGTPSQSLCDRLKVSPRNVSLRMLKS